MKNRCSVALGTTGICLTIVVGTPSSRAQTPFQRMDGNGDNRLSREEFRGPPPAFKRMDRDGDGHISLQEAAGKPLTGGRRRTSRDRGKDRPPSGVENRLAASKPAKLIYVDTHNHLVGPRGRGSKRRFDCEKPAETALAEMDATGVKLNLVLPMPQGGNQKHRLTMEDILPVVGRYPGRFAVLGGGGSLNVLIQEAVKTGRITEAMKRKFDAKAAELIRKGAVGFGEMTAEHFSMGSDHPYESAPPDHPLFLRLADLAARYDVPIDIHMEAVPEEMPLPPRFQSPPNPQTLQPNIERFERLLAHNRKARIIWVHLGWDNTGRRTAELTRELLSRHPNLYMSLRVAAGMKEKGVVKPTFPLDGEGRVRADWLALFEEFPDRFVIGSDEIVRPDNAHPSAGSIASTVGLLEQLPPELRRKIGYENAYRLYKIKR